MLKSQRFNRQFNQGGATLLEVLVTVAVLAVGLLGVAGLLVKSTSLAVSAHDRTISTQKIYSFADRMRLNPQGVRDGRYNALSGATPATCTDCSAGCTSDNIATADFCEWRKELAASLADGEGTVAVGANGLFTITVTWQGKSLNPLATGGQGYDEQTYAMSVRP